MLRNLIRQQIILFELLADSNNSIMFLFMEKKVFLQVKGNLWIKETCSDENARLAVFTWFLCILSL